MIHNDVLRSVRFMLDLSEPKLIEIVQLADPAFVLDKDDVRALLLKEDEPGHQPCSDAVLARFLDGLIVHRRGRNDGQPARPIETRITNNLVLKKLRIAFELTDADMHEVFTSAGFGVSKPELSALFRQPGHRNYRACGDQILRNFLKGLTLRMRDVPENPDATASDDAWAPARQALRTGQPAAPTSAHSRTRK